MPTERMANDQGEKEEDETDRAQYMEVFFLLVNKACLLSQIPFILFSSNSCLSDQLQDLLVKRSGCELYLWTLGGNRTIITGTSQNSIKPF